MAEGRGRPADRLRAAERAERAKAEAVRCREETCLECRDTS